MTDIKKIKFSDFVDKDTASFSDIVNVFDELNKAFENTAKESKKRGKAISEDIESIVGSAKKLKNALDDVKIEAPESSSDIEKLKKQLEGYKQKIKDLKKEKVDLTAAEKALNTEQAKQQRLLGKQAIQTSEIVKANEKLNLQLQKEAKERKKLLKVEQSQNKIKDEDVKLTEAQEGSIDELNGVLSINIALYTRLTKTQRENEAVGGKLLKSIQKQDEELKNLKKEYGDTKASVGNYKDSVIEALEETLPFAGGIQGLITKFEGMRTGLGSAVKGLGKMKAALLATGIGVLVVALAAVSTALTKTEAGANKLRVASAGLGGAFRVAVGALGAWGNDLLGITNANEKAEKSTKGFFDRLIEARDAARAVEELTIAYEKQIVQIDRISTAYKKQAQLQLDIQENDALGYEERKKAATETQALILEAFNAELIIVKKRSEIATKRRDEAKKTGEKLVDIENEYQSVLANNSEIESEFLDFIRNQAELRLKAYSDEAESRLDVAVFVNESLKDAQRDVLENEKSTLKERKAAQLEFNKVQSASLNEAKKDVIDFIELSRDERIKLTKLQIDSIQKVAAAQGGRTTEQSKQEFLLGQSLRRQIELKEQGFDLDKIINAESTEAVLEQFKIQNIGEKFQLRIIEFLQLERAQRLELNQIIRGNAEKENESSRKQLEFRLKANNLTAKEITKLAEFRLLEEKKLLEDNLITIQEYNARRLEEEKSINEELIKDQKANQIAALELRKEFGILTVEEKTKIVDFQLEEDKRLLEEGLITNIEFQAKRKALLDQIDQKSKEKLNQELLDALNLRRKYSELTLEEANQLADLSLEREKELFDKKLITEEEYQKARNEIISAATGKNIEEENKYRDILSSPITSTILNESIKLIENEVVKAGLLAYTNALQEGKGQPEAAKAGFTALTTTQIIKSFAKVAKKDGGTVMGSEGLVWMNEEGNEFVLDHSTTKDLGLQNNASMSDFHDKISSIKDTSYIDAMSEVSKKVMNITQQINFAMPTASEIGQEVGKNMPYAKLDFYDKHLRLLIKSENKVHKEIIYKDHKRHL